MTKQKLTRDYGDLDVSIHLSHAEAVKLKRFILAYGGDGDEQILRAIEIAIANAEGKREE